MKKALASLVLIVVSCAVALGAFEMMVRWLMPEFNPSGHIRFISGDGIRPTLGPANTSLRQIKNAGDFNVEIAFNQYGLRDTKNVATAKPNDILVLGDSFTFGWGIAAGERYSDLLDAGMPHQAFNVAIPGDVDDYERLLSYAQTLGAKARHLVIGLTMENDVRAYGAQPKPSTAPPQPAATSMPGLQDIKGYLLHQSAAYFFTSTVVHGIPVLRDAALSAGLIKPLDTISRDGAVDDQTLQSLFTVLDRIIARADSAVVLVIPSRGLWAGGSQDVWDKTHRAVVDGLKARGIVTVDMRPIFERGGNPLSYHFEHDGHWNPAGHAAAAAALIKHFTQNPQQ